MSRIRQVAMRRDELILEERRKDALGEGADVAMAMEPAVALDAAPNAD